MSYRHVWLEGFFRVECFVQLSVLVVRLLVRILNIIWHHLLFWTSKVKVFFIFIDDSSLLKKCHWIKMKFWGAERRSSISQCHLILDLIHLGIKFSVLKSRFFCFFRSFLVSSVVTFVLICSIKVIQHVVENCGWGHWNVYKLK